MGQTLFDKVWKKHVLHGKEGEPQLLYIDLHSFMKSLLLKRLKDLEYKIVNSEDLI